MSTNGASKRVGEKSSLWRYAPWLFGIVTLAILVLFVVNIGEVERFAAILSNARPQWLLVAIVLQSATYVAAAAVWQRTLSAAGHPVRLRALVPLSLAKLFTDQAVPSVGLSGTVLLARGLARRGIPVDVYTQTLLVTLISFYSAYLVMVLVAIGILWLHHEANSVLVAIAAVFSGIAVAVPVLALSLKQWGTKAPPTWLGRLPGFADLFAKVAEAPTDLLHRGSLLGQTIICQLLVFALDAATFWAVFQALGQPVGILVAFVSFMMASVIATIGPIPVGLGSFEASSVGVLSLLGIEVETALTGTLVLRGLTLWLPMLPGLWLARRELRAAATGKS